LERIFGLKIKVLNEDGFCDGWGVSKYTIVFYKK
jgi:hypothetical protein